MLKSSLKYGIRAALFMIVLSWTNFYATQSLHPAITQWTSIAVIVIAYVFIPVAVKARRSNLGGVITFWEAFFSGASVAIVAAAGMFLSTLAFMTIQKGKFTEWSESAAQIESDSAHAVVMHPVEQGVIMFLMVLFIGSILSLVVAVVFSKK